MLLKKISTVFFVCIIPLDVDIERNLQIRTSFCVCIYFEFVSKARGYIFSQCQNQQ